jgi:hypothetical protein
LIGRRSVPGLLATLVATLAPSLASGETAPTRAIVDRAVVRFVSPETGGSERPRFIGERMLALEARFEMMAEQPDGSGEGYGERQVRVALDRDIGEEMLTALAEKLISGSTVGRRPTDAELTRLQEQLSEALFERLGGRARVEAAAAAEQIDVSELTALWRRQALAAFYVDRAVTPVLDPSDEQLREVFRTSAHPYRGKPFADVREELRRWFIAERLRVAENAFMQGARARLRIVLTR